jgi:ABC-type dipeptide/oligopeptide/nickel transport system permease subunit
MSEKTIELFHENDLPPQIESASVGSIIWRQIRKNRLAILGSVVLILMTLIAIFAAYLAPYNPYEVDYTNHKQPPSAEHLLGTDELGRDVFSRLIYGTRISLVVGMVVVGIAMTIGVTLGAIAGYYGGVVDLIVMRIVDILQAFPFLILAVAMVAVVGPGLMNMMVVLGCVTWIWYTRLVRGMVLSLRETEYIQATRALGASSATIIFRHLIPNVLGVVVVQSTFGVADAILAAAALSYLGLGAQPPTAEWGSMLTSAKEFMRILPAMSIAPGVAIMITVLAINFIGDALRDALDPTVRM